MQTKLFVNFSNEDFTGYWDSTPYRIKSGQEILLEDWKADHFAKHLVDRELQKDGKQVNDQGRDSFIAKCFPPMVENEEMADMPEETKLLNQRKKPGRPKKEEKEESFEGLEDK